MEPRLTIGIPLHGGEKWIEGVIDTIGKAPAWSRIVLSDASHLDDAPTHLADLYQADDRVEVISRPETLGWIQHANALLADADTEFFCWMPQDDLVSPQYFERLVSALDENQDRILASCRVFRNATTGRLRKKPIGEVAYRPPPVELGQASPAEDAVRMLREWNMALACWTGVFRTDQARPIPETADCADLVWTFSMALAGNFILDESSRYLKRFHRGSGLHTMRWEGMSNAMNLYRIEAEARIGSDPALVERVLTEVRRYLRQHRLAQIAAPLRPLGAFALNRPRPILE